MSCFEACSASLLDWQCGCMAFCLGRGNVVHHVPGRFCGEPSQLQGRHLTLARESLRISELYVGNFGWKQWKSALWAELSGLCRMASSLCYRKAFWKRLLTVWNADKLWFHQPEVKWRKIHAEAEVVFQQCNFWVLKEQGQHSQTFFFCCVTSKGTCQITLIFNGTPVQPVGVSWDCANTGLRA